MWRYDVANQVLSHNGAFVARGYSGTGLGRNNPTLEWKPNVGPIPRGHYTVGPSFDHPYLGPCVMRLTPVGHGACGRTDLECHGNNTANDASHGCLILDHPFRVELAESEDKELEVV